VILIGSLILGTASRFVAFALIGLSGCALLIASPALLLLGAWAGADGGSVPKGLANVLGVPWLIFITCLAAVMWAVKRHPSLALIAAVIPPIIESWIYMSFPK